MELHQRITNLVQKESSRLLKDFLNDNPDLLQKYVDGGVAVAGAVLVPLNAFIRHLLVVKGLDPDTSPGERQRQQLLEAVGSLFDENHSKDFDDDYDFSWVHKKFEEARSQLKDLTKDKFMELTDLSKLPSIGPGRYPTVVEEQEYFNQAPSTKLEDKEIPVTQEGESILDNPELKSSLKKLADLIKEAGGPTFDPGQAIETVKKVTKKGIKTSKKKVNKGRGTRVNRVPATLEERATHVNKKNTLNESLRAKYNRAKELTDEMVARGLCSDKKEDVQAQLQEILLMNDDAVESLDRVVKKHTTLPTDDKFKGSFRRTQK